MLNKKITRKEFLKTGFLGVFSFLIFPTMKLFGHKEKNVSHKDAQYYKNLAG